MATSAGSLGLLADRTPFITPAQNAAGPRLLNEPGPPGTAGRSRLLTAPNQTPVPDRVDDISGLPSLTDIQVVPSSAAVSNRLPNALLSRGGRMPPLISPRTCRPPQAAAGC